MKVSHFIYLFLSITSVSCQQEEYILAIVVEPGKVECFYQDLTNPKHVAFEVDYQVTEGGEHDINFMIRTPNGAEVAKDERKTDANHRYEFFIWLTTVMMFQD